MSTILTLNTALQIPRRKTPLTGVASALKGVEFIAKHIKKADKDIEVRPDDELSDWVTLGLHALTLNERIKLHIVTTTAWHASDTLIVPCHLQGVSHLVAQVLAIHMRDTLQCVAVF